MLDIAIRGGTVVDGSGAPGRVADVGIEGGRVVAVVPRGTLGGARRTLEAAGRVVAPGFVDVHTHFDAQVFWDPDLTPSSLHGVTSAMAGNCGFTLTPMRPGAADYLVRMLSVVEGMPLESLQAGVPIDWQSTAEYLDRLDGRLAINAGFLVGHSALRRVVMGVDATARHARPDEVAAMGRLLREGLEAGGLGFSSSWGSAHTDAEGLPVPSRHAAPEEIVALAGECAGIDGTSLEFIPPAALSGPFDDAQRALLTAMSRAAGRTLNWNVLRATVGTEDAAWEALDVGTHARAHGGDVVALLMPIPLRSRYSFGTGFILDALPGWAPTFALAVPDRVRALRDPAVRARLAAGARQAVGTMAVNAQFDQRVITEVFDPDLAAYKGRAVADIAREEGKEPFDALLDIACADELRTTFSRPATWPTAADWAVMASMWRDGRALIGASDAGAHLDFTAYYDYPVYVLEHGVRASGALSLEEAVHLMTDVPARLYGLRDRGRLVEGAWADVVVFDPDRVASGEITTRFDLPAGAARLYTEPEGIDAVCVNGAVVVQDGKLTGARSGRVLRSARDTTSA